MKTCSNCQEVKDENLFYPRYNKCKKCQSISAKIYREKNPSKVSEWSKNSYRRNKSKINEANRKRWAERYEESYKAVKKAYQTNPDNQEKICLSRRIREARRLKTDLDYRLRKNLRNRIHGLMRYGVVKSARTMVLLGCPIDAFKKHIESQFRLGMSWENYGAWQIDHILPCSSFDLSKTDQQFTCFNYQNMQPLWKLDNQKKSDKVGADGLEPTTYGL